MAKARLKPTVISAVWWFADGPDETWCSMNYKIAIHGGRQRPRYSLSDRARACAISHPAAHGNDSGERDDTKLLPFAAGCRGRSRSGTGSAALAATPDRRPRFSALIATALNFGGDKKKKEEHIYTRARRNPRRRERVHR